MAGVLRNFISLVRSTTAIQKPFQPKSITARNFGLSAAVFQPAVVNEKMPHFQGTAVVNQDFAEISTKDFQGKWLVFYFYPLDFTFVCPTEIIAFSDRIAEFKKINAEVVAVSTDSHFSHLAWTNLSRKAGGLGKINYPILSDFSKKIAADYGVLIPEQGIALRGLFIADPNSVIKHITINDLPIGRSVDEVLRVIKALQFVEKHGEVCPANWNPDTNPDTIKPDPVNSKEYFNKQKNE